MVSSENPNFEQLQSVKLGRPSSGSFGSSSLNSTLETLPNHTSAEQFKALNSQQNSHPLHFPVIGTLHPRRSVLFFIKIVFYISFLIFLMNIILYFFNSSGKQEFERDIHSSFEHLEQPHFLLHQSINKDLSESKEKLSLLRKNSVQSTSPTTLSKIKGAFFGGLKTDNGKSAFPLLSRYTPPKVPSIMETFTSDKRITTISESKNGHSIVSIAMGPQKTESGFYIDKENEIKTRIDVSKIPKSTLSIISQMFESKENCIRNDYDLDSKSGVQYTTCKFENICLNRKGDWIIYTHKQLSEMSGRTWVYTSSVYNEDFSSPKFKVKIAKPPTTVLYKGSNNFSIEKEHQSTIVLSKNFKWISLPTFGFYRHSTDEVGSLILENYLPMFNQMADFEYVNYNNNVLYFDDIHNEGSGKYSKSGNEKTEHAEDQSIEFASFISSSLPLQICNNEKHGTFVDLAPCKQLRSVESKTMGKEGDELDTCFSSLIVGSPDSFYLEPEKRHHLTPVFRDFVLNGIGYVPPRSYFEGRKKILIIGVLNNSKKKESIVNVDKLTDFLSGLGKDLLLQVNSFRVPDDRYESIRILNLKLDDMTLVQQIRLFTVMDVFITNQGMDSYYSLFMYNPRALVIYAPMCFSLTNQCTDFNLRVLHTFSNIRVISLMNYLSLIECVKESSDTAKGYPVIQMKSIPKELNGDCHIRINQSGLYSLIIKAVQGKI